MSAVTLTHSESDIEPECTVVIGGGRLNEDSLVDSRRIEIAFSECHYSRSGPHEDTEGVEAIGYQVKPSYDGEMNEYLEWRVREWRAIGFCPDSGFYVAIASEWLSQLPNVFRNGFKHYVVDGRDGYVELVARRFRWREWLWNKSHREDAPSQGPVIGEGEGVA